MQRLVRDGVALAHDDAGSGAPPILLVHGWTHDHTYLAPQFAHFSEHHRVVSVDLRGHGDSDKPEQTYSIQGFADDLAWQIYELGLHRPVVVGHSMGAAVVLDLAGRYGDRISAVVLLDPSTFIPPEVRDALEPTTAGLRSAAFRDVQRALVGNVSFLPTDDPRLAAQITKAMSSAPQHVMAGCWEALLNYDPVPAASVCSVPMLCILAAHPLADIAAFRATCPSVVVGQTVGAGHYHQLLVPEQVNAMIDRFVAIALPAEAREPAAANA
jgi:pimeloyl-ACP methyl ester carboxylesterase